MRLRPPIPQGVILLARRQQRARTPPLPEDLLRRRLSSSSTAQQSRPTSSRNVLGRFERGAPPLPSSSDVRLEVLLGEGAGEQMAPSPGGPAEVESDGQQQALSAPLEEAANSAHKGSHEENEETKAMVVAGVEIPLKPVKPGDEECCMSGCALCIYDIYADSLQEYNAALRLARSALLSSSVPRSAWPGAVLEMDARLLARAERAERRAEEKRAREGGGNVFERELDSERAEKEAVREEVEEEVDDALEDMDPTMRAFLELEKKLSKGS